MKSAHSIQSGPPQAPETVLAGDLFEKCRQYTRPAESRRAGLYPYFRELESGQGPEVRVDGQTLVMFGSNNYLGLANDPRIKEAVINAVEEYGAGSTGSRFLNGNLKIHTILEEELAAFTGKERALVFSTGFLANVGAIACLVGKGDRVLTDRLDHASIIDGCRLALGEMKRFAHNDVLSLDQALGSCPLEAGKLVVVDAVFSMEGDVTPLRALLEIVHKHQAHLMLDEAHSLGVFGSRGGGLAQHLDLSAAVAIIMGTFSKSLASMGGFIAAEATLIEYIKHFSRAQMFTAGLSPADAAAALAALRLIQKEPQRREKLWQNTWRMQQGLKTAGFDTGNTRSPVIPVIIGDDVLGMRMCRRLQDCGLFVNVVLPPGVPKGRTLLRVSCMATHTDKHIDFALETFARIGRELGILSH